MENKRNKSAGITLIALVITIIVLLILAAISINMLTGENSILKRAGDARDLTGTADIEERIKLAYGNAISNGLGDTTKGEFEAELKKEFGNDNVTDLADDLSTVKIKGKEYETGVSKAIPKISDKKTASGETVTAISDSDTTILKDNLGNIIKIPKGFGIATDSGVNVEDGIVIEDAVSTRQTYGSQFVWVPVGPGIKVSSEISASETLDITLGRYSFNESTGTETLVQGQTGTTYIATTLANKVGSTYEFANSTESQEIKGSNYGNTKAKNLSDFVESVLRNGGYYIARYEAGINGTLDNVSIVINTNIPTATDGTIKPQSRAGLGVWDLITQSNAANVCRSMYNTSSDKITSDLVNSYAWDTAIVFIQKCGNNGNDSKKYSLQIGRSSINTDEAQLTGNNKLKYEIGGTIERTTPILDMQCKICDMAGNVCEWSTETASSGGPCVIRGGDFFGTSSKTSDRGYVSNSTNYMRGFRPILYLEY